MREIKFRIACFKDDGTFNGFMDPDDPNKYPDSDMAGESWFSLGLGLNEHDKYPDEFIWQQYTGIKDINGVKIYEGDIVQYKTDYSNRQKHFRVIEIDDIATGCLLFHYNDFSNGNLNWDTLKVVGNKYEHPELLKKC